LRVKFHHFAHRVQHLDAELLLLIFQQPLRVLDQPPYETAAVAFPARFRAGRKEEFRPTEDIDNDGELGLDQWVELSLEQHHNVLQAFNDAAVDAHSQLTLRRLATQLLVSRAAKQFARFRAQRRLVEQRRHGIVEIGRDGNAATARHVGQGADASVNVKSLARIQPGALRQTESRL